MIKFEKYLEPKSIEECCALLKEYGKDAKLLAGGTDLIPRMKADMIKPVAVISMQRIPGIDSIEISPEGVTVGACMKMRKLSLDPRIIAAWPALAEAASHVSSMQIRNAATIGGNACNASPSADGVEGLLVYGAIVNIAGADGKRSVPLCEFFTGPGRTVLKEGELVESFFVPACAKGSGACYKKFAIRGDTDISIVGAGAFVTLGADGVVKDARITLASVAPTPLLAKAAAEGLIGKKLDAAAIAAAGDAAANGCNPISDPRATAEYRKEMVRVWVRHALEDAAKAARA